MTITLPFKENMLAKSSSEVCEVGSAMPGVGGWMKGGGRRGSVGGRVSNGRGSVGGWARGRR